jgi:hypothetical protein
MRDYRLGDDLDDYCIKCKRLTNHSILALVGGEPAKVRCRTCYHEQPFRKGEIPPSKRDLKKAELFAAVLASGNQPVEAAPEVPAAAAAKTTRRKKA